MNSPSEGSRRLAVTLLGLSEERDLNRRVSAVLVYLHNR